MAVERVPRRLAAILAVDVVGNSGLMSADKVADVVRCRRLTEVCHGGKLTRLRLLRSGRNKPGSVPDR